ncbi:MAG: DUF4351 domain-containing protein [Chloroflexi bacterium]|nr:DUF4351 domain-containing protein [Chloroflexota bacterium]
MSNPSRRPSTYDNPWKEVLERYFPDFMAFFFPQAHGDIDWARGHEFLAKELRRVTPDAAVGERRVDELVKVWRKDGVETWVLVHVEVQSQQDTDFAERMYVYNYRLFDRFHRRVASLAVLGDEQVAWRPGRFEYDLWGCRASLEFPIIKLVDYRARWAELDESRNPFATVVMAYLKALETDHNLLDRQAWKLILVRRLYERGYGREDILNLFRFIDWVLALPRELDETFWEQMNQYEEAKRMPYITSVERIGIEKGLEKGMEKGMAKGMAKGMEKGVQRAVVRMLQLRFGAIPAALLRRLEKLDVTRLEELMGAAVQADSLETFSQALELQPA